MPSLRAGSPGCDRDSRPAGRVDRLWRTFDDDTGYDSVTFGYTYGDGRQRRPAPRRASSTRCPGRQRDPGDRVWNGEYSAEYQAEDAPSLVDTVALITPAMCVFTAEGC